MSTSTNTNSITSINQHELLIVPIEAVANRLSSKIANNYIKNQYDKCTITAQQTAQLKTARAYIETHLTPLLDSSRVLFKLIERFNVLGEKNLTTKQLDELEKIRTRVNVIKNTPCYYLSDNINYMHRSAMDLEETVNTCRHILRARGSAEQLNVTVLQKSLFQDLKALKNLGQASWNRLSSEIELVTPDIILLGYNFGKFMIAVDPDLLSKKERCYKIISLEDRHPVQAGTPHPHVRGTTMCEGAADELLKDAWKNGALFFGVQAVLQTLRTYNPGSPFCHMSRWMEAREEQIQQVIRTRERADTAILLVWSTPTSELILEFDNCTPIVTTAAIINRPIIPDLTPVVDTTNPIQTTIESYQGGFVDDIVTPTVDLTPIHEKYPSLITINNQNAAPAAPITVTWCIECFHMLKSDNVSQIDDNLCNDCASNRLPALVGADTWEQTVASAENAH